MEIRVPGDKSISQRALILSSLAEGESRIRGILAGGDPRSTAGALRGLGVTIPPLGPEILVQGRGLRGLLTPDHPLDLGNSGTGARLLLGVLAGQPLEAMITGDASLRKRPMARVTDPLTSMGARFEALGREGCLPMRVKGRSLQPLTYRMPVASAQLKSALLLAGVVGGAEVYLVEPGRSRDHTERALEGLGLSLVTGPVDGGWGVALAVPPPSLPHLDVDVPGDFSSAAFLILLGLMLKSPEAMVLKDVGLNPTRTGLLAVLEQMGARVDVENIKGEEAGELSGDLVVHPSELAGVEVGGEEIPSVIDEVPILAVGAARAHGTTRITGAAELRVKETDRIRALVENLRALGVEAEELDDGLEIEGADGPLRGRIKCYGDHRIAMAFGILNALPGNEVEIDTPEVASVSFPGFWELLAQTKGSGAREEGGSP